MAGGRATEACSRGRRGDFSVCQAATSPFSATITGGPLTALARGFRWRKLLETGDFVTIEEIAEAENINPYYVSRVLRMTLLAPEIVEAILAGRHPPRLTMARAMQPVLVEWVEQTRSPQAQCDRGP
jgi:hypothetical protein